MKDQDYITNSIPQYLNLIKQIQGNEDVCWFRGHSDIRYKLIPTLYRKQELIRCNHGDLDVCSLNTTSGTKPYKFVKNQREAFKLFKKNGLAFVSHQPANDFEWLVLMQHYGGKTQLLDWTCNPLIALYFALSGVKFRNSKTTTKNDDFQISQKKLIKNAVTNNDWINTYQLDVYDNSEFAVVYVMNPLNINDATLRVAEPRIILESNSQYDTILDSYVNFKLNGYDNNYPICIEAPKYDRRAYIQGSGFTLHGYYIDGLDWFNSTRELIYKIYIPNDKVKAMYRDLRETFGITHSFVYQDLGSVVKDSYEE